MAIGDKYASLTSWLQRCGQESPTARTGTGPHGQIPKSHLRSIPPGSMPDTGFPLSI